MRHHMSPAGPLTTPKALRRGTGAHSILVELVLSDLAGLLIALLLGALLGALLFPLIGWGIQFWRVALHASLPLDSAVLVIALILLHGLLRKWVLHKEASESWGCAITLFLIVVAASVILYFAKRAWIAIPSPVFPPVALLPLSWSPPPSLPGLAVAASLYLLAHIRVWQREQRETAAKLRTFSRAHQDGRLCKLLEQVYACYRRRLARFAPPPIERLKTPRMFYFFSPRPLEEGEDEQDTMARSEREVYLVRRELVICQAHLGTRPEQLEILMPLVARLLHDYNSPVALVEQLLRMAELAKSSDWYYLLLPIPLIMARSCERRWQELDRERVLDRDRFAWQCGEAGRLRKLLIGQLAYLNRAGKPDNAVPTIAERIDHLDSLLRNEARQFKELHAALPSTSSIPPTTP